MTSPRRRGESPQSLHRVPRRKISVASFGSASSHDGYDRFSPRLENPRPVNSQDFGGTKVVGFFMCDCCPKKPKKFDTLEELRAHESEKQFECSYCGNRFKSQAETERHQNSLHIRKHSWSCSNLPGYDNTFQESGQRPEECDACGFCGDDFLRSGTAGNGTYPTEQDWDERIRHLQEAHKLHMATGGKWADMLGELCCRKEKD
ncbi:hypothetical protein LB505_014229 [Fusarium chuoi]|nr:hypothetical protein LB505_014229 [Fusarium chuoi]